MTQPQSNGAGKRVAITGAGMISDVHIRGVQRIPGLTVVGIADGDLRRARDRAESFGIPDAFESQRAMLAATSPDVVHVLTPPFTHADLCAEALEADAHVYVEKPMAVSVADCDRMVRAAERAARALCVGHCTLFDPLMTRGLDLLERGELGDLVHASAVYTFDTRRIPGYRNKAWYRALPGGFVEDLASHPVSLLVRVLGAPTAVGVARDRRPERGDNGVAAVVTAERGTGTVFVSLDARPEEVSLEVRCTRGTMVMNFSTMVMTVQRERGLPRKVAHGVRNFEIASQLATQTLASTAQVAAGRRDTTKGIHTLIGEFYRALAEHRAPPVSGAAGRDVVALLRDLWPEPVERAPTSGRVVLRASDESPRSNEDDAVRTSAAAFGAAPMRALVTGATGFIGTHLVRALADRGVEVRALSRTERRGRALLGRPNVEVIVGDFADASVIDGLAEGVDVIFHLASVMTGPRDDFERVDLEGSRRLIAEAKVAGVQRVVFTSTMGAYALGGLRDGTVVTEDMIDAPDRVGHYARAKLLIEAMLLDAQRDGGPEAVITRPGLVFGPGTSPYLTHLPHLGTLRGDRYLVFGDGRVPLQLTYVGNTVDALLLCATCPAAAGETFTIIDDDIPTQREYVEQLAALTGRSLRVATIPRPAAYAIGLGVETMARVARRKPPTTRHLLLGKTTKLAFDCSRAKRVLGWRPVVSWQEGLRRAVEWERARTDGETATTAT